MLRKDRIIVLKIIIVSVVLLLQDFIKLSNLQVEAAPPFCAPFANFNVSTGILILLNASFLEYNKCLPRI